MGKANTKSGAKPYHHGNLRRALVDAALEILESDAETLTIRATAKAVGVSHTAPYNHFAGKEALLAAVAVRGFEDLKAVVEDARRGAGPDAGEQLAAAGRAYVQFAVRHPALFRLMFGPREANPQVEDIRSAGLAAFDSLVGVLRYGMKTGAFRKGDASAAAFTAWSLVHGVAQLALDGVGPLTSDDSKAIEMHLRASHTIMMQGLQRS